MPIDLACPSCNTPFKVDESFAGRRGTCKNCGTKIQIPGMNSSIMRAVSASLENASPEQMIAELARRKISAVLAYSDPSSVTQPAVDVDGDLLDSDVDYRRLLYCLRTQDLGAHNVGRMLEHLGARVRREHLSRAVMPGEGQHQELFELKGDWLGMSLDEFKRKYYRVLPGMGRAMPWCSDEAPGKRIDELNAEPWHAAAGIVTARVDLPAENASPTIAQEATQLVLYQFLDGRLFQIEAYFQTQAFHFIMQALIRKYGKPVSESESPRCLSWWNLSATIELRFGGIRPVRPARLRFFHDDLFEQAVARVPSHTHDI
jgi:hypothetical protein